MYSKLIFEVDGEKIEFHSHELLKVALNLVKEKKRTVPAIPTPELAETFLKGIFSKSLFPDGPTQIMTHPIDKFPLIALLIPFYIDSPDNVESWLNLARELASRYKQDTRQGWWCNLAGRLLLIKNYHADQGRSGFYISDHGSIADIIDVMSETFNINWLINNDAILEVMTTLSEQLLNMSDNEFLAYKAKITAHISKDEVFFSKEEKEEIIEELKDEKQQNYYFEHVKRSLPYIIKILRARVEKLMSEEPRFQDLVQYCSENNNEAIDGLVKFAKCQVLQSLMQDINLGKHEFLFKPVHSYGEDKKGDSYRAFADSIIGYLQLPHALPQSEIARKMRGILQGGKLEPIFEDDLSFLSSLTGAWFIAEAARNELSILSGIMLLDMIENGVYSSDDDGNNLYSWKHILVHPKKAQDSRDSVLIQDLYGAEIDLAYFGGTHPMAHRESVPDSKTAISNGTNLKPVRQKEGSLILRWLYERISVKYKYTKIELLSASTCPLVDKPNYKQIDDLWTASNKFRKKIQKDSTLRKKLDILHKVIIPLLKERLNYTNNLLTHNNIVNYNVSDDKDKSVLKKLLSEFFYGNLVADEDDTIAKIREESKKEFIKDALAEMDFINVLGLSIQDVLGDGNCFFHAVYDQLRTRNNEILTDNSIKHIDELRILAAGYILDHPQEFGPVIEALNPDTINPALYLYNLFQDGEWADDVIISALTKALNLQLIVIQNDGTILKIGAANNTTTLYLGYYKELHYFSVNGTPNVTLGPNQKLNLSNNPDPQQGRISRLPSPGRSLYSFMPSPDAKNQPVPRPPIQGLIEQPLQTIWSNNSLTLN